MNIICVDDEKLMLSYILKKLEDIPDLDQVQGFRNAADTLAYVKNHPVDLAFLDIDMPDMNGIELARRIKEISPLTAVCFTTGYEKYALDAYSVRPTGYLLKPYTTEKLAAEIENVMNMQGLVARRGVTVQTFGEFEAYVDHQPVRFRRSKSKEIFAMLVDRMGQDMSNNEIAENIWPGEEYDRSKQKQMSVFLAEMRNSLEEAGARDVYVRQYGGNRVNISKFECDLIQFMEGNVAAMNAYKGEYMKSYAWAQKTIELLNQKLNRSIDTE